MAYRWRLALAHHLDLLRFVLRWDGSFWRRSPGKLSGALVRAHRPEAPIIAPATRPLPEAKGRVATRSDEAKAASTR
jgi:hypothetical protein